MGQAAAVWGEGDTQALNGSASVSPSNVDEIGTEGFRKVAQKCSHPRLNLSAARAVLRQHAKEVIYGAFPEASRHQTCLKAAAMCGVSPDTIERLIEGDTASPDVLVLGFLARVYRDRTGKVTPICNVIAQIIAAEVSA